MPTPVIVKSRREGNVGILETVMKPMFLQHIIVSLLIGLGGWGCGHKDPPKLSPPATQNQTSILGKDHDNNILGIWHQYMHDRASDGWIFGGAFRVSEDETGLIMTVKDDSKVGDDLTKSQGLSNVLYDGTAWTFRSDWGLQGVGVFKLKKVTPDRYEGYSYLHNEKLDLNRWNRVSK